QKSRSRYQQTPSGRAETRLSHLPWSSGHDFRLSLTPISAGDRGSIPRGRVFMGLWFSAWEWSGVRFPASPSFFRYGVVANIVVSHTTAGGSIPPIGVSFFPIH
ncbi:hypothetical protein N7451_007183, partial [Penicillium sp. IBT 35674x]